MAERERPVGRKQLAEIYGVDIRTITNWVNAGCPRRMVSGSPSFLLSEVIPWRRVQDQKEQRGPESIDREREETLKVKAQREREELKLREERKELVPAADVRRTWERILGVVDMRMTTARGKWARKIMGVGTMQEASAVMDELIAYLRAGLVEGADELEIEEPGADDA